MFTKVLNFLKDANSMHHANNDVVQSAEEALSNSPDLPDFKDPQALFDYANYWEFEAPEHDLERAAYYYLKAAQKGHVEACYRMGKYFENPNRSQGISRLQAKYWYKRAIKKGHKGAAVSYQILKLRKLKGLEFSEWKNAQEKAADNLSLSSSLQLGATNSNHVE